MAKFEDPRHERSLQYEKQCCADVLVFAVTSYKLISAGRSTRNLGRASLTSKLALQRTSS